MAEVHDESCVRLVLPLIDPVSIATLVERGGDQALIVSVGTLVQTFDIGATLTGAVLVMTEGR